MSVCDLLMTTIHFCDSDPIALKRAAVVLSQNFQDFYVMNLGMKNTSRGQKACICHKVKKDMLQKQAKNNGGYSI